MAHFTVLDQASEDNLHAKRLLNIEEKPFKRLTKRLLAPSTPIHSYLYRKPVADAADDSVVTEDDESRNISTPEQQKNFLKSLERFRHDAILDFDAFENSIARIQFLRSANERERQRYATEKLEIEQKAQQVRENTTKLRTQLDEAKKRMEIRKGYDVLAEKVIREEKTRKTRDEQNVGIDKLRAEIEELEREGMELGQAWTDRRHQLGNIVGEATRLRRIVRDEKEPEHEVEGDVDGEEKETEREEEGGAREDDGLLGLDGMRDREGGSNMGTPRPHEDAPTPLPGVHESGALTPRSTLADAEVASPMPGSTSHDREMKDLRSGPVPSVRVNATGDGNDDEMDVS